MRKTERKRQRDNEIILDKVKVRRGKEREIEIRKQTVTVKG